MTLQDLNTGKAIDKIPFEADFKKYLSRMEPLEINAIRVTLAGMIEGQEVVTAGWLPGNNWSETVFQPIFEKATNGSYEASARCFGLFVWEAFMNHPDEWTSGRFYKDGKEIRSRTYFRV